MTFQSRKTGASLGIRLTVDEYTGFSTEDKNQAGSRQSLLIEVNGSLTCLFYKLMGAVAASWCPAACATRRDI
jgi:hypothetical protein